jgi:hypothetical protein
MKNINTKLNTKKIEQFRLAIEVLLMGGLDFWLNSGQSELRLYLREAGRDIVLNIDGTWYIE